ncbi:TolC family protein [Runella sp.]|uniref:TolC family protein n=1 Tax=Runella sp. TaxID=1960881 RepID=UPI003D13E056
MTRIFTLLCVLFLLPFISFSQELLTLESAISVALEKNYAIKIARSREAIAHNDNTRGNAGMLPIVSGSTQANFNNNSVNQTFFPVGTTTRDPLIQKGVQNRNSLSGINLVWTVFDGMGMFATAERLREIEQFGKTTVKINIENTVAQVAAAYYDIIRQKQRLESLKDALDISGTRRELAKANYEVGTTSKSEYLAAQVDYNGDQAALVAQEQFLQNTKVNLNALLMRELGTDFAIPDTIIFRKDLELVQLQQNLKSQNPNLIAANQNRKIASVIEREVKATRLPQVDVLGSYTYNTLSNEVGFGVKTSKTGSLNYGARLVIPIYDGYNQRRREANAKIGTIIAEYQESDLSVQLLSALERTYNTYRNSITLFSFEEQNLKIARQNVDLAFERYKFGNSTAIEFREAQRNAVATESRLIEAAYNVKVTEIELLRLSSSIITDVK